MPDRSRVIHFAEAQVNIPAGERSARVWQRGALDVAFAFPAPPKEQASHIPDEIYIIVCGRGVLIHDDKRDPFARGDILFLADHFKSGQRLSLQNQPTEGARNIPVSTLSSPIYASLICEYRSP